MAPGQLLKDKVGIESQPPSVVAKSVALLMADESRKGQCIYSRRGEYKEVNKVLLGTVVEAMDVGPQDGPGDRQDGPPKLMQALKSLGAGK